MPRKADLWVFPESILVKNVAGRL